MGISYKENCPDIRNTKVVDLIKEIDKVCSLKELIMGVERFWVLEELSLGMIR